MISLSRSVVVAFFLLNFVLSAAAAKSLQSCLTLWDPIDGSPPGSSTPGILQVRTLEWVAISFSNAWKWKVKVKSLSQVRLLATPWTAAHQAPPSMGFSRQEDWTGVPLPSLPISYSPHHVQTRFQRKLTLLIESVIILPSGNSDCHNIFFYFSVFKTKHGP